MILFEGKEVSVEKIWQYASPLVKMVLILVVGHYIIVYLRKIVKKTLETRGNFDQSFVKFVDKTLNIVAHVMIILSALTTIGISTTGLVAAFSAAAVGIAVALKDSLSNVAGGILLLIAPRFSTGDYIEAGGFSGSVINVDLLHTTLLTPDRKQVNIPNGVLVNNQIINYSKEDKRRLDITFPISYESDVEVAKKVAMDTIMKHPLTQTEPDVPFVRVNSYGDSAVNLVTRVWCNAADYWTLHFDLTEEIRKEFDKNGIGIPYNQLDVHIKQ